MTWRDAFFEREADRDGEYIVRSVGWLVKDDGDEVVLAQSLTPDDAAELLHVPAVLITKREALTTDVRELLFHSTVTA